MMPQTCPNCGNPLDNSARFCPSCGAKRGDDTPDVFVLKPGTARLVSEDPPAARDRCVRNASVPQKLSRREKRIARRLQELEAEEAEAASTSAVVCGADTMQPRRANWRLRILSLLIATLVVAAVIGALYLGETISAQAFSPVTEVYAAFSADAPDQAASAYPEELYRAMEGQGYFGPDGPWQTQYNDWEQVYGADFTAVPELKKLSLLGKEEKQACLQAPESEYMVTVRPLVTLRVEYTVAVHSGSADAAVRKTACLGYMDGKWYLLQSEF